MKPSPDQFRRVKQHLLSFSDPLEPPEQMMLDRIEAGEWTEFDERFFEHELLERDLMDAGIGYEEAHRRVLDMQNVRYEPGYEAYLYHPSLILHPAFSAWFSQATRELAARLAAGDD